MSTHDDGRPAFPIVITQDSRYEDYWGMTLRDYFAAQFMVRAQELSESANGWDYEPTAACAYAMADAMLVERAK